MLAHSRIYIKVTVKFKASHDLEKFIDLFFIFPQRKSPFLSFPLAKFNVFFLPSWFIYSTEHKQNNKWKTKSWKAIRFRCRWLILACMFVWNILGKLKCLCGIFIRIFRKKIPHETSAIFELHNLLFWLKGNSQFYIKVRHCISTV